MFSSILTYQSELLLCFSHSVFIDMNVLFILGECITLVSFLCDMQ